MPREMKNSGISWIGDIPKEWDVLPARYAFSEEKTKNTDGRTQNALQFKFGAIVPKSNFDADTDEYVADTITSYTVVRPGTVMINGLNLNYDFVTQRTALVKETGAITSAYLALLPNTERIMPEYATYLFKGYESRMALHNMGSGIRLTLGFKELKRQPILFPTLSEQKRIVEYLDKRCASIAGIISETEMSIAYYRKLKQSVVTEAVTHGIRKDRQSTESGIDWLGKVPDNWSLIKGKYLFIERNQRGNDVELQLLSPTQKYGVIPQKMYEELSGMRAVKLEETVDYSTLKSIYVGDYCISLRSFQGGFEYSRYNGVVSPAYHVFYKAVNLWDDYYRYLFKDVGFIAKMASLTKTFRDGKSISFADFSNSIIPVPPYDEQVEIANYLDSQCAEIDKIIASKETLLLELDKYKKSVIFEYVTGKKEVPVCQ